VQLYRLPGVSVEEYYERYYPYGELASHVIGYTNRISEEDLETLDPEAYRGLQYIGRSGIEQQYEDRLRGMPGYQQVETDANGNIVRLMHEQPAVRGQDIYLSLEIELQGFIYHVLGDYRGSSVLIDPQSGEVLAMVSRPSFNPNLFVHGISEKEWKKINENPYFPLDNKAITGEYPPGSTFKIVTGAAALSEGVVTPTEKIYDGGEYMDKGNASGEVLGWLDFVGGLSYSDNVYFYILGHRLGIDRLERYSRMFGLGEKTGIVDRPADAKYTPRPRRPGGARSPDIR